MRFYFDDLVIPGLIALCVGLIALLVWSSAEENKKWGNFASEHDCKITQKVKGDLVVGTGVGMTGNGQMGTVVTTTQTPDKTAWLCNDGVTYWR